MARCEVCNKGPVYGHRVSHAHNLTKRRWNPNLQRVHVVVLDALLQVDLFREKHARVH